MKPAGSNAIIDEKDLKSIWKLFRKNWYILAVSIILAIIAANINIHRVTTIYGAKIRIIFNANNTNDLEGAILRGLGVKPRNENMANEMYIIGSLSLLEKVVNKLDFNISYFIKGRVNTREVYGGTPFEVDYKIKNSAFYDFPFDINVVDNNHYKLSYVINDDERFEKIHPFGIPLITEDFELYIDATSAVRPKSIKEIAYMFKIHTVPHLVAKYKAAMDISNFEWTGLIEITVQDVIPERAKVFLDTLAAVYIDNSLEVQKEININTLKFIDDQLADIVTELNSIEIGLENYKKDNLTIDIGNEKGLYFGTLIQYKTEKSKLEIEYQILENLKKYLNANLDSLPVSLPIFETYYDQYLLTNIKNLYELQKQRKQLTISLQEGTLSYTRLDKEINDLKASIIEYIVTAKRSVQEEIKIVSKQIEEQTKLVKQLPRVERDLINIERKLSINEKIYLYLLEKKAETIIARASIVSDKTVLEPASNVGVIYPDKDSILYNYIGIGAIVALIIIFIRKIFFNSIENREDLELITSLPIAGVIPRSKRADSYLVVEDRPKSIVTEAFRTIRANFEYLAPNHHKKMILVTSCMAKEGKTFTAVNTATIMAKTGKKVLLLELDLHQPKVPIALNLSNDLGVSTILIDKASIEEATKDSGIENLDVILAGPVPPNPSELIITDKFKSFMNKLKEKYDYIIIDTPPVGLITDALILMQYTDINLFILRASYAKKEFVSIAHKIKESNDPKNLCFILNGVKNSAMRYGYGYGYGYGYSQGHGYYD